MTEISTKVLIARINRKLTADGEVLRTARGQGFRLEVGDYYAINISGNYITAKHVDPEAWGRELGVLQPFECVGESDE